LYYTYKDINVRTLILAAAFALAMGAAGAQADETETFEWAEAPNLPTAQYAPVGVAGNGQAIWKGCDIIHSLCHAWEQSDQTGAGGQLAAPR